MATEDRQTVLEDEQPALGEVMSCVFGIKEHEYRTYLALLDAPGSTVAELADDLDRDRSNVNRSLTTLLEKNLVTRDRRLLDPGGYVYQYTAVPLPDVKDMLHASLDSWTERVHDRIEDVESDGVAAE
jgi:predicted transcriptional regulator